MKIVFAGWNGSLEKARKRLELMQELCVAQGHEVLSQDDGRAFDECDVVLINVGLWGDKSENLYRDIGVAVAAEKLILVHDTTDDFYCPDECELTWPVCNNERESWSLSWLGAIDSEILCAMHQSWKFKYGSSSPFPIMEDRPFRCPASCLYAIHWIQRHVDSAVSKAKNGGQEVLLR